MTSSLYAWGWLAGASAEQLSPAAYPAPSGALRLCAGGFGVGYVLSSTDAAVLSFGGDGGEHLAPLLCGAAVPLCAAAGYEFGLLVSLDGQQLQLCGWGCNTHGQAPPRSPLPPGPRVARLAAGERHALLLLADGSVLGVGDGGSGQLGPQWRDGRREAAPVPLPAACVCVAAGARHSLFALAGAAGVAACGWGLYGQLGNGDIADAAQPVALPSLAGVSITQVAAGLAHSLALTDGGDVYAWGRNDVGQLGLGAAGRGASAPTLLEAPEVADGDVVALCAGARHSAALLRDGGVLCWGWGAHGAVGGGGTEDVASPARVPLPGRATELQCGWWHTVALVR